MLALRMYFYRTLTTLQWDTLNVCLCVYPKSAVSRVNKLRKSDGEVIDLAGTQTVGGKQK